MSSVFAKQTPYAWALILVLLGTVIHLVMGFTTELSVDEAHYALYANHLAWSYYDHPPLVGWIQWPLVAINAPDGILRLIPILLWMVSCALVYQLAYQFSEYCNAHQLFQAGQSPIDSSIAGLLALVMIVFAPLPHVLAVGLVPDSLLTPLSLGIMWMAFCWIKQEGKFSIQQWLTLGVLFGLAGLSKYTAVLYACAFAMACLSIQRFTFLKESGFYLALIIALMLISPVLLWNANHEWISFKYQINHGSGDTWLWRRVAAFIGIQVGVFGFLPILGIWAYFKWINIQARPFIPILFLFFAFPFCIFAVMAGGGSLPHWTTPAWFCLAPLAGLGLASWWQVGKRWFIALFMAIQGTLVLVGFTLVMTAGYPIASQIKLNPLADLYGWRSASTLANLLVSELKASGIAVQNWTLASRVAWYARPTSVFVLDERQDQFDLWFGSLPEGSNIILLNWSQMSFKPPVGEGQFRTCRLLDRLSIAHRGEPLSQFELSYCQGWGGKAQPKREALSLRP
jgi:4-amino-4-deoxy-L-arabinose transferase-like glycosyltransferase